MYISLKKAKSFCFESLPQMHGSFWELQNNSNLSWSDSAKNITFIVKMLF